MQSGCGFGIQKHIDICNLDNYSLRANIYDNNLVLQITKTSFSSNSIYQSQKIQISTSTTLNTLFDSIQDLINYLKQSANVKFDQNKVQLIVLSKHPTKKAQIVELCKIKLNQRIIQSKDNLNQIISLCSKEDKIQDNTLKFILKQFANKLLDIDKKNNQQDINRIFTKLEHFGQQIQNTKLKTADLFMQMDQLKKNKPQYVVKMQQKLEKQSQQIQNLKQIIEKNKQNMDKLIQTLKEQQNLIKNMNQMVLKFKQKQKQKYQEQKFMIERQQQPQKIINEAEIMECFDKTAKFYRHFVVRGNNITKQDDFIFPTILIGSKSMKNFPEFTVKAKKMGIIKKIYPGVCIGIVDSKHRNKQSCDNNDNVIQYSCAGKLFQKNKYLLTQGKGFQADDIINVKLDLVEGSVFWFVNQQLRCKHTNSQLIKNPAIDWRPYIFMRDKGDSVDWILK